MPSATPPPAPAPTLRLLLDSLPRVYGSEASALAPVVLPSEGRGASLARLSAADLLHVMHAVARCSAASLCACAATCRALRAVAAEVVPGLALTLYPHQRGALSWMWWREAASATFASPLLRTGVALTLDGTYKLPFCVSIATSTLFSPWLGGASATVSLTDCRGGLLCDDAGMGKTVTVLAFILRWRGSYSAAPAGAATGEDAAHGMRWYLRTLPQASRGKPAGEKLVLLARATLLIIPENLIDHWVEQAAKCVQPSVAPLCMLLESSTKNAAALACADIVITTMSRLSTAQRDSPLFGIHWKRIIVDEGHALGSVSITSRHVNACALLAERRWIITGTPTPELAQVSLADQVARLRPLLEFIREPLFEAEAHWKAAILAPLRAGDAEATGRLRALLVRILARSTKEHLACDLPPCRRVTKMLEFLPAHARSYNLFVEQTKRAMLLADWNSPLCQQSLLHPSQRQHLSRTVDATFLACNVAGSMASNVDEKDVVGALGMLCDAAHDGWKGISPAYHVQPGWAPPSDADLQKAESAWRHGGTCERCAAKVRVALVTPCCHVLCLQCAGASRTECPLCRAP